MKFTLHRKPDSKAQKIPYAALQIAGSKIVMAHTTKNAYQVKYKLYELEDILGGNFMRVAKSTILNLDKIYAITRSISNCQIKFEESYKTVYVSRHYYRDLRNRLEERRNFQ